MFRHALFRGASLSFAMRLANVGLAYGTTVLLARLLSPSGFGLFSFVLALVTVLALPAQFGISMLLVREVSAARVRGEWGVIKGAGRWAHRFTLVASAVVLAVFVPATLAFQHRAPPGLVPAALWGAALIPLLPLVAVREALLRGLNRIVVGQAPEQLVRPGLLLAFLAVPLLWGGRLSGPAEAMALNVLAAGGAWAVGALLLLRVWPKEVRAAAPVTDGPRWLRSILPFGLSNGMYLLDTQVGVLLLGVLASTAEVGVYRVAAQFALLVAMGYVAVNTVVGPRLAAAHAGGDREALQRTVTHGARLSLAFCAPVAVGFILLGRPLVALIFGPEYAGAWAPLAILAAAQLVNAGLGSAASLLIMTHNERCNTWSFGAGLAVNLALCLLLAPRFGVTGAAAAAAASVCVSNLMLWRFARARTGIETGFWGA